MRAGPIAVACLLAVACSERGIVPTEAETVDQFKRDRTGFEAAVRTVTADPRILRIEREANGDLSVLPSGADRDRVASVASFMERHDILHVWTGGNTDPSVHFTTFERTGHSRYESRILTYRPDERPPVRVVASTDEEIRRNPAIDHTVYRSLGDGWYIRATSVPRD